MEQIIPKPRPFPRAFQTALEQILSGLKKYQDWYCCRQTRELINASNVKDLVKEISPFIPRPVKDLLSRLKPPTIQDLAALENIDCEDMVVYIPIGDVANPGDGKGEFAYAGSATEVGKGYHRRLVEYARNHQL
jgi:hypothetical protein